MKNKLQKFIKGQLGQGGIIALVGLVIFVAGILCLLVWGTDMNNRSGWLVPGIILTGGGFAILSLGARGGGG